MDASANSLSYFRVRADPEPDDVAVGLHAKWRDSQARRGPTEIDAICFEVQSRMPGVRLQDLEASDPQRGGLAPAIGHTRPRRRGSASMPHRGLLRPARCSDNA